jgi:hypothetical protein
MDIAGCNNEQGSEGDEVKESSGELYLTIS